MKFNITLTPLNEGQEINYSERFLGTLDALLARCHQMQSGLQILLPEGEFTVLLTNWGDDGKQFVCKDGKLYDRETFTEIPLQKSLTT